MFSKVVRVFKKKYFDDELTCVGNADLVVCLGVFSGLVVGYIDGFDVARGGYWADQGNFEGNLLVAFLRKETCVKYIIYDGE